MVLHPRVYSTTPHCQALEQLDSLNHHCRTSTQTSSTAGIIVTLHGPIQIDARRANIPGSVDHHHSLIPVNMRTQTQICFHSLTMANNGDNVYEFKEGNPIYFTRGKYQGVTGKFISSADGIARVSVDGQEAVVTQVDHNEFRLHPRAGFVISMR